MEALYKDLHAHQELSMEETRTAGIAADRLRAAGHEVMVGAGKTGVVGLLRNGDGPMIMLRADMDALPIEEGTDLPYASKATSTDREGNTVPVGHIAGTTCMSRGSLVRRQCSPPHARRGAGQSSNLAKEIAEGCAGDDR